MNNSFTSWDADLYHSGIKGMRWGVRRWQNPDGTLTEAGKRRYGNLSNFKRLTDKRPAKYLTDKELRDRIARKELENKYKDLGRSGVIKKIADFAEKHAEKKEAKEKRDFEKLKTEAEVIKAKEARLQAKEERKKAKEEKKLWKTTAKETEQNNARLKLKIQRNTQTIRGGIAKAFNNKFSSIKGHMSREEKESKKLEYLLKIAESKQKISDIENFGSLTLEDVENRAIARANRRRRH